MLAPTRRLASLALAVALTACKGAPDYPTDGAVVYDNYCSQCHQPDGSGNAEAGAPGIAGLPAWYVEAQLGKFRGGQRGRHFDDIHGMRMRPMAMALRTDEQITNVAGYVASLAPVEPEVTITDGNAEAGAAAFATCTACHGANGAGNESLGAPPLTHTNDWYLVRQLEHFKSGVRGLAEGDTTGATMAPMAATLADEQAIKDVVAYIGTL